jgi:hypothetical protein
MFSNQPRRSLSFARPEKRAIFGLRFVLELQLAQSGSAISLRRHKATALSKTKETKTQTGKGCKVSLRNVTRKTVTK